MPLPIARADPSSFAAPPEEAHNALQEVLRMAMPQQAAAPQQQPQQAVPASFSGTFVTPQPTAQSSDPTAPPPQAQQPDPWTVQFEAVQHDPFGAPSQRTGMY